MIKKRDILVQAMRWQKNYLKSPMIIDNVKRVSNYANSDDSSTYWTLNVRDGGGGNIKR